MPAYARAHAAVWRTEAGGAPALRARTHYFRDGERVARPPSITDNSDLLKSACLRMASWLRCLAHNAASSPLYQVEGQVCVLHALYLYALAPTCMLVR